MKASLDGINGINGIEDRPSPNFVWFLEILKTAAVKASLDRKLEIYFAPAESHDVTRYAGYVGKLRARGFGMGYMVLSRRRKDGRRVTVRPGIVTQDERVLDGEAVLLDDRVTPYVVIRRYRIDGRGFWRRR